MYDECGKLAKTRCTDCVHFKVSCFIGGGYWCEKELFYPSMPETMPTDCECYEFDERKFWNGNGKGEAK